MVLLDYLHHYQTDLTSLNFDGKNKTGTAKKSTKEARIPVLWLDSGVRTGEAKDEDWRSQRTGNWDKDKTGNETRAVA